MIEHQVLREMKIEMAFSLVLFQDFEDKQEIQLLEIITLSWSSIGFYFTLGIKNAKCLSTVHFKTLLFIVNSSI